jgi:hypothetical protein
MRLDLRLQEHRVSESSPFNRGEAQENRFSPNFSRVWIINGALSVLQEYVPEIDATRSTCPVAKDRGLRRVPVGGRV